MGKLVDLTGQRFGMLVVLEQAGISVNPDGSPGTALWRCKCDCGNETVVRSANLRRGNTSSCGCLRVKTNKLSPADKKLDLTGQRFGKLTVLHKYSQMCDGYTAWVCRCDCGIEVAYPSRLLRYGGATSCGVCDGLEVYI